MKKKTRNLILSIVFTLVLLLTFTITYALFTYNETSTSNNQLVMGDIYMHYKENNQLILNDAMPQEGFKTLLTGYKVNPIMADQDASDTTTELYACINLFENEWGWDLVEGEDFESFCKGTETIDGWTLQMYLDNGFSVDEYNTMLSLNIIQEETIEYTNIKLNPEIATQTVEYENELTACVYFFDSMGINEALDEGSTTETFCKGTGTIMEGTTLQQFWDANNQQDDFMELFGNTLINNNIMVLENDLYVVNPNMVNQTVGEINELMTCVSLVTREGYEFDEGTTAESFCKGEGTYDGGITLKGEFEEAKDNIFYMNFVGSKLLDNNIILASSDLPYFEFTISGKNTYSEKDIYYDIKLNHGDNHETRNTRLEDKFLKFRLTEVNPDKTEKIIFNNKSYSSLENKRVHVETIPKNTMDEINKTYRLYMWINEDVVIGNMDEDYTIDEWNDVFASIKINVSGDFGEKELAYEDKYDVTDESCFTTTINDNEITITGYNTTCGTDVVIPNTIDGYLVTTIGDSAFTNDDSEHNLTSIILPNNLVTIGNSAFYLQKFKEIKIPATVKEIGFNAFKYASLETVVFASNSQLVEIGESAFLGNNISNLILPDSLQIIKSQAFVWNNLVEIVIPDSVIEIGQGAFAETLLERVVLGSNVQIIGHSAFSLGTWDCNPISLNYIQTVVNKSGKTFDWSSIFEQTSSDGNTTFETGTFKYYKGGDKEVLITLE